MDWHRLLNSPRWLMGLMSLACIAMLAFGILYLQNTLGLRPCPMCIVQRYALMALALCCALAALLPPGWPTRVLAALAALVAGFGAFVAARQSWLQWMPPAEPACGRDFYAMIEAFPLKRVIPMIFSGTGDCLAVQWTFLGGSIANWSLVWFLVFCLMAVWLVFRRR